MSPPVRPRWLKIDQASDYTGFAVGTIYNMVSERRVPYVKKGGSLRFDVRDLDKWMERDKTACIDDY
jgi:excisionase family DNA binding protein